MTLNENKSESCGAYFGTKSSSVPLAVQDTQPIPFNSCLDAENPNGFLNGEESEGGSRHWPPLARRTTRAGCGPKVPTPNSGIASPIAFVTFLSTVTKLLTKVDVTSQLGAAIYHGGKAW